MGCICSKNETDDFQRCNTCDIMLHHKNMNKVLKPQLKGKYYCQQCFYRSKRFYTDILSYEYT